MTIIINKIITLDKRFAKSAQIIKKKLPDCQKTLNNIGIGETLAKMAQLKKRNVVSCFPFSGAPLFGRRSMTWKMAVSAVFVVTLLLPSANPILAATLVIREDTARFHSDTVRYPVANTFMISPLDTKNKQACSRPYVDSCSQLPTAHFQLGSAALTFSERQSLLAGLRRCEIAKTIPLHVTGYTCSLGTEEGNHILSLHRAREVAGLLQAMGDTIEDRDIQGKGEEKPLTNDPEKFALNRRVEISLR